MTDEPSRTAQSGLTGPEKTDAQSLVDNLYEEPVEYYKEAARFITRVEAAYEASKTGDPNDEDVQYRNLLRLASDIKEALNVYR